MKMQVNGKEPLLEDSCNDRRSKFSETRNVKLATGYKNIGNQASPGNHATGRKQNQIDYILED